MLVDKPELQLVEEKVYLESVEDSAQERYSFKTSFFITTVSTNDRSISESAQSRTYGTRPG
ncbi:hypothetical protein KSD_34870 [Ktedonobacter sp. SOSP1-85]|uniref:Uncharacterized protein n=1 Tax=Ktedonobacter robiniae TaxID=2778365 RepID=A0ABQ3UJ16_9CHLR|nr:hypothetical protein KSB_11830 [Ktedonobacter robiniae]GHO75716.1 hypothetical protein KSD_34870 [Ktedonobacter sp. SOSP1-85]